MRIKDLEIKNRLGGHARASAKLAIYASKFINTNIIVEYKGHKVNSKSILSLTLLGLNKGAVIRFYIDGPQEELAILVLSELIEDRFGEDE
ncbi:HPr family phosphocarrier protein [Paraglaciecola sp.]|uniref:HPr family phosphocarrier protein n=1 Tax=Paraglaciecola sp. TaxID=1920173 RepID=UPI0030F3B920